MCVESIHRMIFEETSLILTSSQQIGTTSKYDLEIDDDCSLPKTHINSDSLNHVTLSR